ncbi:DNRLRE domain-containing protein [Streptomyces sp. ISL-43]|uniref:DNRLRE domain-containing protein n=1 Tax=Streptomyces sp. ISL-43 TaxID=2819183 RepID=UPI001BE8F996|nr:DNRLRE domain-containing protein [Streptomyces sp. ISL-43]MBT2452777.1 DNRLRE domain-containing protein [Streptomyces sp. ISL-43]
MADDPPRQRWFKRRRTMGGLAALLAVAVAVPVGVELGGGAESARKPAGESGKTSASQARKLAAERGEDVEVSAERSANTTTWAQSDGLFKKQISSSAVRAKVGDEWKPIDTDLQHVDGGFAAKAVNGAVVFSAGTDGGRAARGAVRSALTVDEPGQAWTELVRLSVDGHEMSVSWPGVLPAPVIDGPRALYENVRPGIDLLMTAQDGGYSHLLVVKDKQAAADPLLAEIEYRLASPDLQFQLDGESGSLSAKDAKGEEVAGSPSPLMWDSSGKVATTDDVPAWKPSDAARKHPTLGLPGLAGAERAHLSVAAASLADSTLTLKADAALLNAADTVYPVFVDPSFKGHKRSWSLLYKTAGNSSFYNGQNYNASGTNEARVGYESDSGGTSRSIFNFDFGSELHGAGIRSASVRALQTYSWSCTRKDMDIYSTPYVSSSSTWNNTTGWWGNKIGTENAGYGYNSSCPDNWVAPDIKGLVTTAASARWGALSLGFKAPNESDSYYWKKLLANGESAPYIEVTYNSPPDIPVAANMSTSPGGPCLTSGTGTSIGKTDVSFQVKGTDRDGNLARLQIEVWDAESGANIDNVWRDVNSDGVITHSVPWSKFTSGRKYFWLSRAVDHDGFGASGSGPADSGGGGWCTFTIDHTAPANPIVRSSHFPPPGPDGAEWSLAPASTPDQWIEFLGNGTAATSIREYQWSLNKSSYDQKVTPWQNDLASIKLQVDTAGPNVLYVRTVNTAGNISVPTEYLFYVSPRAGTDKPGDVTGDHFADLLAIDKDGNLRTYAGDRQGDTDAFIPGAVENGKPVAPGHFKDPASAIPALIGHATDWHPGDGITDMIARMPDGKLYIYPGTGTGQFDAGRRIEMQLPLSAPDPATFRQIVVTEDIDGDQLPDLFALDADGFWAFSGYTGSSFASYRKMATGWAARDIVGVRDISGDNIPDLLFRDNANANRTMALRKGKAGANGGADLTSLQFAANAEGGVDNTYATTAWNRADWPKVLGTEDNTGDGIPDIWGVSSADGYQYYFQGGATTYGEASGRDEDGWSTFLTIG